MLTVGFLGALASWLTGQRALPLQLCCHGQGRGCRIRLTASCRKPEEALLAPARRGGEVSAGRLPATNWEPNKRSTSMIAAHRLQAAQNCSRALAGAWRATSSSSSALLPDGGPYASSSSSSDAAEAAGVAAAAEAQQHAAAAAASAASEPPPPAHPLLQRILRTDLAAEVSEIAS